MYLMYLSDVWFYNTEDTYMYTYSDLMVLILIRYLMPNNDIDFDKLERFNIHSYASRKSKTKPISTNSIYIMQMFQKLKQSQKMQHSKFSG